MKTHRENILEWRKSRISDVPTRRECQISHLSANGPPTVIDPDVHGIEDGACFSLSSTSFKVAEGDSAASVAVHHPRTGPSQVPRILRADRQIGYWLRYMQLQPKCMGLVHTILLLL